MTTQEKIQNDLKEAMKSKNAEKLSTLRMLLAALQSRQIEKRTKVGDQTVFLTDDETAAVMRQEAKKRQDSVRQFTEAGRSELATKERAELGIIQSYLPKEIGDPELEALVRKIVSGMGEITTKDFGKIIGAVMKEAKGTVSGDRVLGVVKKIFNNVIFS